MENSSPSQTSLDSPIALAPDAFPAGPSIAALLGLIGLSVVVAVVSIIAYIAAHHGIASVKNVPISFLLSVQVVMDLCWVAYLVVVLPALSKRPLRDLGFRTPTLNQIGIALAGAVIMIVVVNGLGSLIDAALHTKHQQEAIKLFLSVRDPLTKAGFALLACVVAPIAEEMTFRVFIFNALRSRGFWPAAIVSGIFFGLAHLDKYAFVPLILGGIVLCGVYARSRNAWMSMITHACFNAVSLIALYAAPQLTK